MSSDENDPHLFAHKTVLITGGTGSFGQAFLQRLRSRASFGEVRIFSRDELKQHELRTRIDDPRVKFMIGDVRDRDSVTRAMRGVDYVFHAAALKQVPTCEFFPVEAVRTNVLGSQHVIECARDHGVAGVVCLSTDKAVQPVNAMGMTKGLMERVAQSYARDSNRGSTTVSTVRYGNVLASRGSVIPLFVEQILGGRPVTLTVRSMTRFLLPLSQAIELVEFALERAEPGDIFVRKAPAATIEDLATALHRLLGRPERVRVIGRRHGEKIFESLASAEEMARAEDLGDYLRIPMDERDLNYQTFFSEGSSEQGGEDYSSHTTTRLDVEELVELLRDLPELQSTLEHLEARR